MIMVAVKCSEIHQSFLLFLMVSHDLKVVLFLYFKASCCVSL